VTVAARRAAGVLALLGLLLLAVIAKAATRPAFPPLSGRVVDAANLLTPAIETALTAKLAALETSTGRQLVVATVPTLGGYEVEEYGYQLGRAWGIGEDKADNGSILLVAPNERAVRIEVGYGLEGVLTDAMSASIIQGQIIPRFKAGDMPGGIVAGTDALIGLLSLPQAEAQARATAAAAEPTAAAPSEEEGVPLVVIILIVFFVLWLMTRGGGRRGRRRRGGGLADVLIWSAINSAGGGGWSGGGGGGGGFSGGGGSFGGGGASGRW
jgi:uncharacterized protein